MNLSVQIASQLRQVYTGGNWTAVNVKDTLADVTWQLATTQVYGFNTIATLVYHTHYYVSIVLKVYEGEPLQGNDKLSFICPAINTQQEWDMLCKAAFDDAEKLAMFIEQMPEDKWWQNIGPEKYGNYYRNIHGIIEHLHYHLGQMVLIKKILLQKA